MIEWLTTIPGILVLCGVVLLVIAIILFIVGARKTNVEEVLNNNQTVENNFNNIANDNMVDVTANVPTEPVAESVTTVSQAEPVSIVSNIETPVVEPQTVVNEPINFEDNVASIPQVQEQPVADTPIYGGEAPKVDFTVQEEKPVTIYGGNDPLEATQTFPSLEENHVPYGGSFSEIKIAEPTVESVSSFPVSEETVEMPVIEPVIENEEFVSTQEVQNFDTVNISEPEVVNISVDEPVQFEEKPVVDTIIPTPVEVPVIEMPTIEPVMQVEEVVSVPEIQNVEPVINEPEVVTIPTDDQVVEVASNVEEL